MIAIDEIILWAATRVSCSQVPHCRIPAAGIRVISNMSGHYQPYRNSISVVSNCFVRSQNPVGHGLVSPQLVLGFNLHVDVK